MKFEKLSELIGERITGEWGQEPILEGIKVLRTTNFTNEGKLNLATVVERYVDNKKIAKKSLQIGDIIIEKSGGGPTQPVGRVVYFDIVSEEKYLCNNFTTILRPKRDKVDSKYLLYQMLYLHKSGRTKKYQNKTTGIHNLILEKYLQEKIPVPSLPDQLHIANLLTKAENLIAQRKESIRLLDEFLKSTFLEMFGDTRHLTKSDIVKTIGEICTTRGGGTPSKANLEYYTGNIPWVSPKDMKWLYITTSQDKITHQAIDESSTKLIPKGSLLMVIRSGILKSKLPLAINNVEVTINQDMKAFISKEVTTEYLLYFFFSEERNILKKVKGTTADNLNFDDIKKMKIKVPPIQLQTKFAKIVEKTEALKTQYQESLTELENLYGSLSQRAFRGELNLKDQGMLIAAEPDVSYEKL